jgi:hypothetical protein
MDAPAVCPTLHEDDAPSDTDAFGVHDRIARTIAQVVEQTHGGKTIGLSGTWGAGKSTVVRLLQTMYADRADSRVVWTFDAWAHEGDPLRRTFLESLIATLAERRWLVAAEWTDTLDFLSKRRKVTQRHSAPRLTPMGVLVAVSVLLVPVGTVLFSNQIRDGIVFGLDLSPNWLAILGLLLALGPLIALLAWSAWITVRPRTTGTGWRDELMNALTVFIQRTDTDSYTESLDSGDPTSLEFEAVFRGIMTAALGAHPERRLVLVVDNLDRVGAPQALAVWSTLQTFVQRRGSGGWIDQVWCLLPFDADAIRRLWQKENTPGNPVAESFLDKTFQLRFEVPLPQLANWKDYLVAALSRALPDHATSDEFFRIYRLYSVRRSANWVAPTPRQLKIFVNQVGSLHRQWQHEIPLEDLAYYVLLQGEGVPIVSMLLTGELPAPAEAGLVSDRARDSLAALVYGSGAGQSHELLLRQPILDALEAGDTSRLDELARVSDKFWLVLELAIEQGCQEWPRAEGGLVLHAAAALDGVSLEARESPWRVRALFRRLEFAVRATQVWAPMDARAVDGAIVMARHASALSPIMHEGFTSLRFNRTVMTPAQARGFVDDYVRLCSGLGDVRPTNQLSTQDHETYIAVARALAAVDVDGAAWTHFAPVDAAGFVAALCSHDPATSWRGVVPVAVSAGVSAWNDLIGKASKGLKADEGYTSAQQVEMLGALHVLADSGNTEAVKLLDDLTDAIGAAVAPERPMERALKMAIAAVGRPADASADIAAAADPDALGAWLYTILVRQGSLSGISHTRRDMDAVDEHARKWIDLQIATVTDDLCLMLAKAASAFGHAGKLFEVGRNAEGFRHSPHDRTVMIRVLAVMADMAAPRVFPTSLVIDEWDASFPGWSRYDLVKTMRSRRRDVTDALLNVPFDWRLAGACAGALDAAGDDDQLKALCTGSLPAVAPEAWNASLAGGEMGLPLLHAALVRRGSVVRLPAAVRSVLEAFVIDPPSNQWIDRGTAATIMAAFDDGEREGIVERIVDAFMRLAESEGFLTAPTRAALARARSLAAFAGDALLKVRQPWERPQVFAGVAAYVLGAPAHEWFAPLSELARAQPELVRNLAADERQALSGLLKRQQSNAAISPEARASLAVLAEMLAGTVPRDAGGLQET